MYKFIGESFTYHNLIPKVDIKLEHNKKYSVNIQSDSQIIVVNGRQIQTEPNEIHVVFSNGAWIPYSPKCFKKHWQKI